MKTLCQFVVTLILGTRGMYRREMRRMVPIRLQRKIYSTKKYTAVIWLYIKNGRYNMQ